MRRRHIRATIAMLVLIPGLLIVVAIASMLVPSLWPMFVIGYAGFLLIGGSYLRHTWSCPNCGRYLGQGQFLPGWDIVLCRYCGVQLR